MIYWKALRQYKPLRQLIAHGGIPVRFRINGHGLNTHLFYGLYDPDRNFASIGDQYFFHGVLLKFNQQLFLVNGITFRYTYLFDYTVSWGSYNVLHLHGFQDK